VAEELRRRGLEHAVIESADRLSPKVQVGVRGGKKSIA
jgi:hypothetical protein